jgi:hypothetical protein
MENKPRSGDILKGFINQMAKDVIEKYFKGKIVTFIKA